jgi:hypothetical protein
LRSHRNQPGARAIGRGLARLCLRERARILRFSIPQKRRSEEMAEAIWERLVNVWDKPVNLFCFSVVNPACRPTNLQRRPCLPKLFSFWPSPLYQFELPSSYAFPFSWPAIDKRHLLSYPLPRQIMELFTRCSAHRGTKALAGFLEANKTSACRDSTGTLLQATALSG